MVLIKNRHLTNVILLGLTFLVTLFILNTLLVNIGLGEGISLGEMILDEIRIRFLPDPNNEACMINRTHLQPGCEEILYGQFLWVPADLVSINNAGFRDSAYPQNKAVDAYRIFVLGDSFTFGVGVDNNETYAKMLEHYLNQHSGNVTFEVLNLGMPGSGTYTEYVTLQRYSDYSPDMVILQTLSNDGSDCIRDAPPIQEPGTGSLEPCTCIRHYFQEIQTLAASLSAALVIYDIDHVVSSCLSLEHDFFYLTAGSFVNERRYHLSRVDSHPNKKGHRLMALDLLPVILNITTSQVIG